MRNNVEGARIEECTFAKGNKQGVLIVATAIAGTYTLDRDSAPMVYLPLASAQNVVMPTNEAGLTFVITNTSAGASTITIKDSDGSTTRGTIAQNASAMVTSDGTRWWVLAMS